MTDRESRNLQTCGKGWFILKMAEDHDVDTFIKLPKYPTKDNAYDRLQGSRKNILRDIANNWDIRIRVEDPEVSNARLKNILNDIIEKIYY